MRDPWKKHSEDDNGEVSVHLPCYRHSYSRSPLESTCEVVPEAVNQLTQLLWKEARPFLAPNSMSTPPNYWEQCIYYTAFKGAMGRHRDNFKSHDLVSYLATKDASILTSAKYAQVPNSTVMIFTTGNAPMNLKLSYPRSCKNAGLVETYVTHPMLSVKLSHGTLLMFAPIFGSSNLNPLLVGKKIAQQQIIFPLVGRKTPTFVVPSSACIRPSFESLHQLLRQLAGLQVRWSMSATYQSIKCPMFFF